MLLSHALGRFLLVTIFFVLLRFDPQSAPAATGALAYWEFLNRKPATN